MLHFANDYTQGACQEILDAIVKTNFENLSGYGADKYCESAKAKIRKACELENADVYFLVGGTQTNAVVINSMLQSYEGVIAAETGHISVHEAGTLLGEAVVFTKNNTPKNFVTRIKQQGALLAKGWLLRVQFDTLFSNDLYKRIGKHTIDLSEKLKNILHKKNYRFYLESPTNQQFIIIENIKMEELEKKVSFSFWEKYDEKHTVIRLVTSWATTEKDLNELVKLL
ncbi:hypothetical protein JMUB5056_2042 [Leptotrichia hongkongensis]|jgi:glycine hydroxymethyltransferase|uniref:Aromatic amino acid beta-eliminating lyase/threonine aldolase domain-containing protein n=1 Tax=Leptotrichia hongkongensis TaxID=554406 RepID=A0A510L9I6_9FUSO|nr:beta-eliminating lyase-related protein [Leptotrichia hongkongensis]BBM60436.1 hypothetical protein JMUB5056_2042 [Leptotrichia hongkongensis]